ncbi:MAG: hypothetical protein K8L99_26165 [Anaerolineae bacterium]|nr:hypothetical protein [Anaerolineae bacterium]
MTVEELLQQRDTKSIPHLEQYAPVWIVDQKIIPDEGAVQFNVAFEHKMYGWVNRRYRYDGFNHVLYYKGQNLLDDEDALRIQDEDPYIQTVVTDIPNSYGG